MRHGLLSAILSDNHNKRKLDLETGGTGAMEDWKCQHCGWSISGVTNNNQPKSCYLCDEKSENDKKKNEGIQYHSMTRNDFLNQVQSGQKVFNRYVCIYEDSSDGSDHQTLATLSISKSLGSVTIKDCVIVNPLMLNGSTFTGDVTLSNSHFVNGIQLDNCVLEGSLTGDRMVVKRQIDLSGAKVTGRVSLQNATFNTLSVTAATFNNDLELTGSTFLDVFSGNSLVVHGNAIFDACRFKEEFYLSDANITKDLSFLNSVFEDDAIFVMVTSLSNTLSPDTQPTPSQYHAKEKDATNHEKPIPTADKLQGGVELEGAQFLKGVRFEDCVFVGWVDAQRILCRKQFVIERTHFECGLDLQEARFDEIEQVSLRGSRFLGYVNLSRASSTGMLRISDCYFYEAIILRYTTLQSIVWNNLEVGGNVLASYMTLKGNLWWSDCIFLKHVDLQGGFFEGEVELREDHIGGDLKLTDARFEDRTDLASTKIDGYLFLRNVVASVMLITRQQVQGKLASEVGRPRDFETAKLEWEFLMRRFDQRSNYDDLDFAWFKSRQMQRAAAMYKNPFSFVVRLFELLLVEWGTGYGMRPWNVVRLALVIIVIFGGVYHFLPDTITINEVAYHHGFVVDGREFDRAYHERILPPPPNTPPSVCDGIVMEQDNCLPRLDVADHLYLSFGIFTGLDFGEIHPSYYGWLKYIVATESFLGIFILALFASILTRKLIRQ